MDRNLPAFGALLRRYRLSVGLTQQELAERATLSLRGVSDLERGIRRAPYVDTIDRLSAALELGPTDRAILRAAGRRRSRSMPLPSSERISRQLEPMEAAGRQKPTPRAHTGLPFVGRQTELDALLAMLGAAREGNGGLALVSGEPGIGKTRLVLEVAEHAQAQGWRVLFGRATDVEGAPAYLPIVEALRTYADACPPETLRMQLAKVAPDVALLLPAMGYAPSNPPGSGLSAESARYALLASACDFLLTIAEASDSGLLLVLEDLHWADAGTLLLIRFLAPRLTGARFVVVGTHRSAELDLTPTLGELLADLSREGVGLRVPLASLSRREVSSLIAGFHGATVPGEVVDGLYAETGGNPFFLSCMLRHLVSTGRDLGDAKAMAMPRSIPEDVRWVIRQRLSRLSEAANELLRAGAVLGEWFDFDVLSDMLGTGNESPVAAIDEAVAADLLRPDGTHYQFAHALIRETLYTALSLPRRQRLHCIAADSIVRLRGHRIEDYLASIAAHYRLAGSSADGTTAIEFSLRAGEAAQAVFAWEEVATNWEAALELMQEQGTDPEMRARHLERLAELMVIRGWDYYAKQITYLERALELYQRAGAVEQLTRVHIEIASAYSANNATTMHMQRGMHHFQAAEALLAEHPHQRLRSSFERKLASAHVWSGRTADGLAASRRALSVETAIAPYDRLVTPSAAGWHLAADGRLAEGLAMLERAWVASNGRDVMQSFVASAFRSDWAFFLGDPRSAYDWRLRELGNSQVAMSRRQAILSGMATACAETGDLAEATRLQAEAGTPGLDLLVVLFAAPMIAFRSGDWHASHAMWTEARERHRRTGSRWCEADFAFWLARVHRLQGEISAAEAALCEALAIGIEAPSEAIEMWTRPELAILCAEDGRNAEAEHHLVRCRAILAAGEDWRGLAGCVALAEAVSASARSGAEVAEKGFGQALSIFQRWSLPWNEAEALCAWGRALAADGTSHLALHKFNAARDIYRRRGSNEPWLRRVDAIQNGA
jgi:transcriptional regulator with XRE-family HTH domain